MSLKIEFQPKQNYYYFTCSACFVVLRCRVEKWWHSSRHSSRRSCTSTQPHAHARTIAPLARTSLTCESDTKIVSISCVSALNGSDTSSVGKRVRATPLLERNADKKYDTMKCAAHAPSPLFTLIVVHQGAAIVQKKKKSCCLKCSKVVKRMVRIAHSCRRRSRVHIVANSGRRERPSCAALARFRANLKRFAFFCSLQMHTATHAHASITRDTRGLR